MIIYLSGRRYTQTTRFVLNLSRRELKTQEKRRKERKEIERTTPLLRNELWVRVVVSNFCAANDVAGGGGQRRLSQHSAQGHKEDG